jgi:hypothetical protein
LLTARRPASRDANQAARDIPEAEPHYRRLATAKQGPVDKAVWNEPYLETCCRAALHRLFLSAGSGRPAGVADQPCLKRLSGMDLCQHAADGRYRLTDAGAVRHAMEVVNIPAKRGRRSVVRTTAT